MSYRGARRLHIALMSWITLTFITGWLPFVRGVMDGPTYQWGGGLFAWNFSGAGPGGDLRRRPTGPVAAEIATQPARAK